MMIRYDECGRNVRREPSNVLFVCVHVITLHYFLASPCTIYAVVAALLIPLCDRGLQSEISNNLRNLNDSLRRLHTTIKGKNSQRLNFLNVLSLLANGRKYSRIIIFFTLKWRSPLNSFIWNIQSFLLDLNSFK